MSKTIVNIHGKEYEPVASRLKRFQNDAKGDYSLITEVVSIEGGFITVKCTIEYGNKKVTGLAMEEISERGINSTSAMEVAETSAVGRCLAHAGYFGSEFPSADEMITAVKGQAANDSGATPKQKALINQKCNQLNLDYEERIVGITSVKLASEVIEELLAMDEEQQTNSDFASSSAYKKESDELAF